MEIDKANLWENNFNKSFPQIKKKNTLLMPYAYAQKTRKQM